MRFDLPREARERLGRCFRAEERVPGLHEFARRIRLDHFAFDDLLLRRVSRVVGRREHAVRTAGRYAIGSTEFEVDDIELVPFSSVTAADLRKTGEPDLESLRRRAAHAGPIADDTLVYRIEFHVVSAEGGEIRWDMSRDS